MDAYEREEQALVDDYNDGKITLKEFNYAMHELNEGYREAAKEAAGQAYQEEMDRW